MKKKTYQIWLNEETGRYQMISNLNLVELIQRTCKLVHEFASGSEEHAQMVRDHVVQRGKKPRKSA